ncbi:MAG: SusC/RagA family TonB-linked outer membrane protein [Prevotellaceae bacterium]|nr:SusC/RagA family TonB-linked outer membrane protein [Prevotellaceae bacterium]
MKRKRKAKSGVFINTRLWVILLLFCSFSLNAGVFAQKISVVLKEASGEEVFRSIRQISDYTFVYDSDAVKQIPAFTSTVKDATIDEIMTLYLKGTDFSYVIEDNVVIIRSTGNTQQSSQQQQTIQVSGAVTDAKKTPLSGVFITLKGTERGTLTDEKGHYIMYFSEDAEKPTLVFSLIGMKQVEMAYSGEPIMNIVMEEEIQNLDDVIVTGYMNIDKGSYVGAVYSVKVDEIKIAGEATIDQMLQGVVPGMQVLMSSGQVGATPKIRIRGTSTILGNQEPVWVVDGVIQLDPLPMQEGSGSLAGDLTELREIASNSISWLNPNDIETITVLKDASATAIYGSKAANGVIVITTKRAKPGNISASYSGNYSIGQKPGYGLYDLMNSQELMQFAHEIYRERSRYTLDVLPIGYANLMYRLQNKEIDNATFAAEYAVMENRNTDWFDLLFRNTFNNSHNLSVSGGNEKITNRTSFSIQNQLGEAKGNDLSSYSASSNTTIKLGNRLTVNFLLNGSIRETNGFAYGVNPFNYAYNTARTIPMYGDDGNLFYHEKRGETSTVQANKYSYLYNIQNEIDNSGNKNTTKSLSSTIDVRLKLLKNIEYQGLLSYSASSAEIKSFATELSYYITQKRGYEYESVLPNSREELASRLPYGGLVQIENAHNNGYTLRNSLVYNDRFSDLHRLTVQLGSEMRSTLTQGNTATRYGYLRYRGEGFAPVPLSPATITNSGAENLNEAMRLNSRIVDRESNYVSEYFSAVYGFDERYILNVNARVDASNRFGQDENKRFQPTWSAGVKWRVANEHFLDRLTWFNSFDLSASYGYQGNAVEAVSPYLVATDGGLSSFVKQYTLNIKSLPYPDLGWEKTNTWNLSLDFAMWDNRFNATVNLYEKNSDILASREVPVENGQNNATIMGSKMINKGYDLIVSLIPIRTKNFTWQFSVNTGIARNTLKNNGRVNVLNDYLSGQAIVSGEAYSTFYSFAFDGLDGVNGRPLFKNMDIDPSDNDLNYLVKTGKLEPDFSGGFNTMFRYKNIALRAQFAMSMGGQRRLPVFYNATGAPTPEQNAPRILQERWRTPGDEVYTNIPSIPEGNINRVNIYLPTLTSSYMSPYTMYNQSDLRIGDTDFVRCRQISLSYEFDRKLLRKIYAKRLNISLSMSNPFMITFDKSWRGYDPETGGWPARRTTSLSISTTF